MYSENFKNRWTQHHLHSTVKELPIGPNALKVGDHHHITINVPPQGVGVRGILFGDVMTHGGGIGDAGGTKLSSILECRGAVHRLLATC